MQHSTSDLLNVHQRLDVSLWCRVVTFLRQLQFEITNLDLDLFATAQQVCLHCDEVGTSQQSGSAREFSERMGVWVTTAATPD